MPVCAPAPADSLPEREDRQADGQGDYGDGEGRDHAVAPSRVLIHAVTASSAEAPNVAGIVMPVG